MPRGTGWLSLVGFFGLAVAAGAQTPLSQTAGSQFDGTYALVSSAKLTQMFTGPHGLRYCPDGTAGPLTIARGQARLSITYYGNVPVDFEGTVGSQGELAMRSAIPLMRDHLVERLLNGRIDGTGTVRARLTNPNCNFDYVWRK
jgi:hypothetical protein